MSHKKSFYRIDVIREGQTFVHPLPMNYTVSLFVVAKMLKESWEKINKGDRILIVRMCAECRSEETILDVRAEHLEELTVMLVSKRALDEWEAFVAGRSETG